MFEICRRTSGERQNDACMNTCMYVIFFIFFNGDACENA